VAQGLVQRQVDPDDRRFVTLSLTAHGRELAERIMAAEDRLYDTLDRLTAGAPVEDALLLRAVANAFPTGQALARRRGDEPATTPGTAAARAT